MEAPHLEADTGTVSTRPGESIYFVTVYLVDSQTRRSPFADVYGDSAEQAAARAKMVASTSRLP